MTIVKKQPNKGFYVSNNRISKAKKIIAVLKEELNGNLNNSIILDIGTGNGEISTYLAHNAKQVISVDISNNRSIDGAYSFLLCDENLPFKEDFFDIVISNHVIEHVNNNKLHLNEIHRVLKLDGVVYLATPNRLWPWEVHYRLPLIHYLPKKWFIKLLKGFNVYHEDLNLLFWSQLKKLIGNTFTFTIYCDHIAREPCKYHINMSQTMIKLLKLVPLKIYTLATSINPTIIITLRKKN